MNILNVTLGLLILLFAMTIIGCSSVPSRRTCVRYDSYGVGHRANCNEDPFIH